MSTSPAENKSRIYQLTAAGALPLLLLLALALRLCNIDATSLWIDEIYSFMVGNVHPVPQVLVPKVQTAADFYRQFLAWQPMNFETLIALLKINVHMPLYYLLLNPWLGMFGNDAFGLRSFAAVFSTLMLVPLYALGSALGGRRTGLLAAFVAAVVPFQIYYGQEGRMYALTLFWACLSALAFWKTLHSEKSWQWGALHAVATALGMLSHYMFAFYLTFQVGYAVLWLLRQRDFKRIASFGPTVLALAAVVVTWAPIYKIQQNGIDADYHFAKGLVDASRYLVSLVWQPLVMVAGDNRLERVFYVPATVLLALYWFSGLGKRPEEPRFIFRREGFLLCWILMPMLAQIGYDFLKETHTVVVDRYVMLISPAMLLLLALALSRLFESGRRGIAWGLVTAMLALGIAAVWNPSPFRDEHNKRDMKTKFAYFRKNVQPGDLVFVNGPLGAPNLAAYYLNRLKTDQPMLYWLNVYRGQEVPLPEPSQLAPYKRVWLFRNRANNERGLQVAKEHLQKNFPTVVEWEEKNDWFLFSRE